MTLGEKIRFHRKQLKMTQTELGEKLGVKTNAVSKWEVGRVEDIPTSKIKQLASIFCVPISYLIDDAASQPKKMIPSGYTSMPPMKEVPIIGNVACGTPITAQQESGGTTYIPGDWHADFVIIAVGDSMAPDIRDGDLVAIRSQHQVDNGQIAAVHIGEEATLKRLYFYPDKNRLELRPINPAYEMQVYFGDELYDVIVDGLAIGLCRSFE